MIPTSTLLHALKDQIRNVKYSIRAEAHMPGSMVPRAFQSREVRRLTSISSVVSTPAFRLVDGIVTRVETIAMDLLGASSPGDGNAVDPVDGYLADGFEFTDKLFRLLRQIVDYKGGPSVFVSEQALDSAWAGVAKDLPQSGAGVEPILACAVLAVALARAQAVRRLGFQPGEPESNYVGAPGLYCGIVAGLMIAVTTARPAKPEDGISLLESADSVVRARFDRFRRAMETGSSAEAVAVEYRKLIPFLP